MDLSFSRDFDARVTVLPHRAAVLLADAGARQAASSTAVMARALTPLMPINALLAPESGAFSASTAAALIGWQDL